MIIIQGNFGNGWEDVDSAKTEDESIYLLNNYILSDRFNTYRIKPI